MKYKSKTKIVIEMTRTGEVSDSETFTNIIKQIENMAVVELDQLFENTSYCTIKEAKVEEFKVDRT